MLNLLAALTPDSAAFWMIVLLGFLLLVELAIFAVAALRNRARASEERRLVSLTLDAAVVKREYKVGEPLDASGLIVMAHYNLEPFSEPLEKYDITAPELDDEGNFLTAGKFLVTISFGGKSAVYAVAVVDPEEKPAPVPVVYQQPVIPVIPEPEPEPVIAPVVEPVPEPVVVPVVEEESVEAGTLRYDRSFTARLIQSDDELKHWYTEIKNELLSYNKAKPRMSWKRESFRLGRETLAKLSFRGKTLCLYLPLNAAEFEDTKYKVEDVSDSSSNEDTPCMFRIKNERRVKYAIDLIELAAAKYGAERIEHESEDFYMPYEGIVELINKGLIKRDIKSQAEESFFRESAAERDAEKEAAVAADSKTK